MDMLRQAGQAPKVTRLGEEISRLGPCLGCRECRGICQALIEALSLPEAVLRKSRS